MSRNSTLMHLMALTLHRLLRWYISFRLHYHSKNWWWPLFLEIVTSFVQFEANLKPDKINQSPQVPQISRRFFTQEHQSQLSETRIRAFWNEALLHQQKGTSYFQEPSRRQLTCSYPMRRRPDMRRWRPQSITEKIKHPPPADHIFE
jgi:hypothetical protein